ncbi:heparinase II/III domain-containing protein [Pedobacter nanyangensis]|uniref:heparinase II/III domain-containing protein n=1 Tax=Pedobacter nanyangensis TaxID=1562389 RepID=UPI000DE4420A|nr:heparinase II/III family protein [Pedobacter nanyangensis]
MMVKNCLSKRVFAIHILLLVICAKVAVAQNANLSHSYDYSKIAPHPRILLNKGEEQLVKKSIASNPEFLTVYSHIIGFSNKLLAEKPLEFKKDGKRLLAVSRKALTRLYYLSFSYRMTKEVKYLNKVEEELNAVCNFESWNPSHFLDVGEMCMAVAIAYDWLYDDLKESTKQHVRKAILEKAFEPSYIKEDAWFLERHNNWNSVCNAGLLFGALAIFESEKEKSIAIIERTLTSNKLPLEAYGPDGNYPEGPGYWNYGTSFQVMLFAALESALGSDNGLSKAPGFMNTANYMLYAVGTSGKYFNYYDGGASVAASPSMFWFASKLKDPSLVYTEIKAIKNGLYTRTNKSDEERLIPNMLVFAKNLKLSALKAPINQLYKGNGITPIAIVRTDWESGKGRYLGIKGGKAEDAHGHMDQGTFVYDVGYLRWAADFGLQSYITLESKGVDLWNMSQNSERWDIFRYNNLNHNTLTINNQRHNVNGFAKMVSTFDNRKELGALVDIKPALNLKNELKVATRKATIVDGAYLKIEDVLETGADPVDLRWNMLTPAAAKIIDQQTIMLSQQGKNLVVKFKSDIPLNLVIRPSEDPAKYKNEFGNSNYGEYNQKNIGTVMIGFDAKIPANKKVTFKVVLEDN